MYRGVRVRSTIYNRASCLSGLAVWHIQFLASHTSSTYVACRYIMYSKIITGTAEGGGGREKIIIGTAEGGGGREKIITGTAEGGGGRGKNAYIGTRFQRCGRQRGSRYACN